MKRHTFVQKIVWLTFVMIFQVRCLAQENRSTDMPVGTTAILAEIEKRSACNLSPPWEFGQKTPYFPYLPWLMALNPEERAALIPGVKNLRDRPQERGGLETWNNLLIFLGDEALLEKALSADQTWIDGLEYYPGSRLPLLIEKDLLNPDKHVLIQSDMVMPTKSFQASGRLLQYLGHNKNYSAEVREWAHWTLDNEEEGVNGARERRRISRDWLLKNRELMLANKFADVKPGERLPRLVRNTAAQPSREPVGTERDIRRVELTPLRNETAHPSRTTDGKGDKSAVSRWNGNVAFFVGGGVAALLAAGTVFWKWKAKANKVPD